MFAVTSRCNARCGFCSIPSQVPESDRAASEIERAIDQLHSLGIRYIQITGGEPLLFPHLISTVRHASSLGMLLTVVTNGSLLDEKRVKALAENGVQGISISVDHPDSVILEENRGIPGLAKRITRGVSYLNDFRIPAQASSTISKLLSLEAGDYGRLVEQNAKLGFDGTYFCYPMPGMQSNYALGGDIVRFNRDELAGIIRHIVELKRQGYPIDNSPETLSAVLAYLEGRQSRHPCVAGYKVFYLDWHLDLYDCMTKGNLIGSLLELDAQGLQLQRRECEECILSCDREPSIYQHGWRSVAPFLRLVRDTVVRRVPV
jgi:MoaA/NifB/PqqE/SkfB family radical SAM enzyme